MGKSAVLAKLAKKIEEDNKFNIFYHFVPVSSSTREVSTIIMRMSSFFIKDEKGYYLLIYSFNNL